MGYMCGSCEHEHQLSEQVVRYVTTDRDAVEPTHHVCQEPECPCASLDPTDHEDRVALITAGEIDA
ncbi:hypothetical protein LCGC14_1003150 [marine sediment metagenome]|uniref:Uncharacterized protein n=1 Tax=marine sediment metagenome TaxID=412755 RepID=A0A0F9N2J1_9ZZZZ